MSENSEINATPILAPAQSTTEPAVTESETEDKTQPEIQTSSAHKDINELEFLTEQFENYLRMAKSLMKTLKRPKDIEICNDLIRKVERLNRSQHLEAKRNNNRFFRYCLKILNWTSNNQPMDYYNYWYNQTQDDGSVEPLTETRTWLEDNKSYLAIKTLKDGTSIIYGAMSNDAEAGWQDGGLNVLAKRGVACQRS